MGLEDVAALLTKDRTTQKQLVRTMRTIGKRRVTLREMMEEGEFNERYVRFLITKLRSIRLLMGEKERSRYVYYLSHEAFSTFLKTKYSDAIYNLVKRE